MAHVQSKIGLMGGTFDPIHFGHLFIAEEARTVCGLEKVIFFPNNQPAHREGKEATAGPETRFELTQIAIAANPHFEISRVELDRPGPSYAYDTLQIFRREFGSDAELF
jgi:nicotinate-nucleotide adenylyltransferase